MVKLVTNFIGDALDDEKSKNKSDIWRNTKNASDFASFKSITSYHDIL
ncbi:hypothetical protein [Flavobacterium filum]|nr:hypothetical protein [Flavobacterium filum]